ncbi:MAG: hypothetical protein Q7K33_02575 [Candidatus Berkelbacteria bacterium]|nr:hypothetical protein [Candidatus Berkelbacteria bacterium]
MSAKTEEKLMTEGEAISFVSAGRKEHQEGKTKELKSFRSVG